MALTTQEQNELDRLELEQLQSEKAALSPAMSGLRQEARTPGLNPAEQMGIAAQGMYEKSKEMVMSAGLRGVPPALGQVLGRRFAGKPGQVVGGAAGGVIGSGLDQSRLILQGKQEGFKGGQFLADAMAGANPARGVAGNAIPNMVAANAESLIDEGQLAGIERTAASGAGALAGAKLSKKITGASATPYELLMKERKDAFRDLRGEGVVIAPFEIQRGNKTIEGIAGKSATGQQASQNNQYAWQKLARKDLGLSPSVGAFVPTRKTPSGNLIPGEIDQVIKAQYEPYEAIKQRSLAAQKEVAKLKSGASGHDLEIKLDTPEAQKLLLQASADVDALKVARFNASEAYKRFKEGNPGAYEAWQAARNTAESLDDKISAAFPEEAKRLAESRKKIAIAYAYKNAITAEGNGLVDPSELAKQLNSDVPLSGNALRIARFHNAFSRDAVEAIRSPAPGVDNMSSNFAARNMAQGNVAGFLASGVPVAGGYARKALLSNQFQNAIARPQFQPNVEQFSSALARFAPQAAGRQGELPPAFSLQDFMRYMPQGQTQ